MSNLGLWDNWYSGLRPDEPQTYGDTQSYELAAEWLHDCQTVGDWGCGKGGFRRFVSPPREYVGFDGSATPFADRTVDLAEFRFETEGILLRHVIEHDYRWAQILHNATHSFTRRLVVIVFTPMIDSPRSVTEEIGFQKMTSGAGVPDLAFSLPAITDVVGLDPSEVRTLHTITQYGLETALRFDRGTVSDG